ncbi:RND family efflux transporter, MFP subunit [Sunxiuqinia elliptica]|uniref:RND family efflux transporter, MFP subunit n=2 Tax=Sunxiuqinia elliptica TaxID=655355 RepID=A0A1I2D7M1_9BACT|nr:RND family efflux transporter, MFP subunit [Sunxiuqinia elliptica]
MRKTKISYLILAFFAGLVSFLWIGCSNDTPKQGLETRYVKTTIVQKKKSTLTETFPGVLKELDEAKLSFRIAGPVDQLPVKEGQFVKKGQLLACIDPRDYQLQYDVALSEYKQIIGETERVKQLYAKNNITDNDYEKAMSGRKQITAKLNAAKNALNDIRLVAPFDGYIQTVFISKREIIDAGMPVVSIINASSLKVEAAIPASIYLKKDLFSNFYCTSSNYPGKQFPLTLLGINAKSELNKLYKISLTLKDLKDIILAPGMNVLVHFTYDSGSSNAIQIPLNSCFEKDGQTFVYKFKSGQAVLTKVKVGDINRNNMINILLGLKEGDIIITAGHSQISNGQKVKRL